MALTDTKLQRLQAKERAYQLADGGGLYVEVQPTGKTVWRMQYRLGGRGSKKERVTLGEYPAHTLSQARLWREQCRALIAHGQSPAAAKQAERVAQAGRATDPDQQRAAQHPPRPRQGRPTRHRRQTSS